MFSLWKIASAKQSAARLAHGGMPALVADRAETWEDQLLVFPAAAGSA